MSELPDQGHFALFALPLRFRLDEAALGAAWRALQAQFHPDRAAHLSAVEQRRALQWATRINEAYNVLRDPLARAAHLLELNGAPVDLERNVGADAEFLAQQMQWREALEDARSDANALAALAREVENAAREQQDALARACDDQQDYAAAAQWLRRLHFTERIRAEIARFSSHRMTDGTAANC